MVELQGQWLTYPAESVDSDKTIIVTIRQDVDKFRDNPRFRYRITVAWPYAGDADAMPDEPTSELMEQATDGLADVFRKDPVAVLTELSTGDNRREWVFYTLSLPIFSKKLNEALAALPTLPLEFDAEEDPNWEIHNATD
jgi:hypothetical protein